jgi:hypothetical protein
MLPSGKKVNTKGISFKHVNVDAGTNLILGINLEFKKKICKIAIPLHKNLS